MSDLVILLNYLTKGKNRARLQSNLKKLKIEEPFNTMIHEMCQLDHKADVSKKGLMTMATLHNLPQSIIDGLVESNGDVPEDAIARRSVERLKGITTLSNIQQYLESSNPIDERLAGIGKLFASHTPITTAPPDIRTTRQLKPQKEMKAYVNVFDMELYAGDLFLLCAYPGIGKTNTTLSLAKEWASLGHKIYYLSLRDWSWAKLERKLYKKKFPDHIYWQVESIINIVDIESHVDYVQPSIFIVDGLEYISTFTDTEQTYMRLGQVCGELKRIAQDRGIVGVVTHQLSKNNLYPNPDDLKDGKSHILAHPDLACGLGGFSNNNLRNVTYMKIRNQEWHNTVEKIPMDYGNFLINFDQGEIRDDSSIEQHGMDTKETEQPNERPDKPTSRRQQRRRP